MSQDQEPFESALDRALERPSGRYIVGIDLGTTNCAVAFVDTLANSKKVETFQLEQLVDWNMVEKRDTLPSFHYQLTERESHSLQHRWIVGGKHAYVVGILARDRGLQMPGRQVASAKSWLCHPGVDRTAPLLPWHGDEDVQRLSPVAASAAYLLHIRTCWNAHHPNALLEEQDVVVTLPASFDEIARELTVEAAKGAGIPRVILLEEPQAAFYAWLHRHGEDWTKTIQTGQSILVCDIGGGTTDLTLIRVRAASASEQSIEAKASSDASSTPKRLHRVAVGQHLILGGDNLDLALAKAAESMLVGGGQLPPRDWDSLRLHCRVAKEAMLGEQPPTEFVITLAGSGSKLLSQTRTVTIDQAMIQKVLLDGFFPLVGIDARPIAQASGFQEFGLPYAQDAAVTKHLASFLWEHRFAGRSETECAAMDDRLAARPDFILFNGGVLEAKRIKERIIEQLNHWFVSAAGEEDGWHIQTLEGNRLDLAVAQGAAYFGLVRRGEGIRIDASLARSYYLQVSSDPPRVMCLVPGDTKSGDTIRLTDHPFDLMLGQPVEFPLWVSSTRLTDPPGALIDIDEEHLKPMPPIRTVLESPRHRRAEPIPVVVEAELTEIGTMHLACSTPERNQRWKLEFDIRSAVETDREAHQGLAEQAGFVDQGTIERAFEVIDRAFGENPSLDPNEVVRAITASTELARNEWPPSLLRSLWGRLMDLDDGRKHSAKHEARWLNLAGYFLRPGYGFAADDWRVATTWRKVQGKLRFRQGTSASEAIILWRRIAGGFTAGQQTALYQEIAPRLKSLIAQDGRINLPTNEAIELVRLAGSLELLPLSERGPLARGLIVHLQRKKRSPLITAMLWTIGRLGARVPLYGSIHQLAPASQVESWIDTLLPLDLPLPEKGFALMQLARRTGDRYRDVGQAQRETVLRWMEENGSSDSMKRLVRDGGALSEELRTTALGESMPLGLRLRS